MFKVSPNITKEQIQDLLILAFEGGSNYWYRIENDDNDDTPLYERPFNKGLKVSNYIIHQNEGVNLVEVVLNPETLEKGLQVMMKSFETHFEDVVSENTDIVTGDIFLQCVMFGDVLYG